MARATDIKSVYGGSSPFARSRQLVLRADKSSFAPLTEVHKNPQIPNAVPLNLSRDRVKIEYFLKEWNSEIPCLVSSDAHEWYNDLVTVSGICSVKIQGR